MYRQFIIPQTDRQRILDGCRIGVDYGQWITSDDAGLFRCRFPDYDQPVFSKYRCRMESDVSESKSAGFIPDTGYPAISSDLGIGWRLASATFLRFHCGGNRMGLFMVSC